jgi:hypothetical protein
LDRRQGYSQSRGEEMDPCSCWELKPGHPDNIFTVQKVFISIAFVNHSLANATNVIIFILGGIAPQEFREQVSLRTHT